MAIGKHLHNAAKWIAKHPAQSIAIAKKTIDGVKEVKRVVKRAKTASREKKFKPKGTTIIGKGLAGETTSVSLTNKMPKKSKYNIIKHIGNNSTYVVNSVQGTVSAAGLQNNATYFLTNSQTDVQNAWAAGSAFYEGGAVQQPSMTNVGFKVSKFFLKNSHVKCEFTNQSPAICNFEIWTVISKVTKPTYRSPGQDWADGIADQDGLGVESINTAGFRPTQAKLFNMNWKVKSRKRVSLMGGETHTHNSNFQVNRYMDSEYFNTYQQIRGITMVTFVVQWGQVADTTNGPSIGAITVAPTKLIAYVQKTYTYSIVNILSS